MFRLFYRLSFFVCLLALAACDLPPDGNIDDANGFVGTDITGADFVNTLSLVDHTGQRRTMGDFKGRAVVMFFGFTHCPDVCPTTMVELKKVMKLLGDKASQVQVLFITVDPERDTQKILAKFVTSFGSRFIGLRGSLQETVKTLSDFKIYYQKVPGKTAGEYTIDHSAGMYVFDKMGKIRLYLSFGQKPTEIASDIQKLL